MQLSMARTIDCPHTDCDASVRSWAEFNDHIRNEHGPDEGSPEAEAAMHREAMRRLRAEEPWRFADDDEMDRLGIDRRIFHVDGDCA